MLAASPRARARSSKRPYVGVYSATFACPAREGGRGRTWAGTARLGAALGERRGRGGGGAGGGGCRRARRTRPSGGPRLGGRRRTPGSTAADPDRSEGEALRR